MVTFANLEGLLFGFKNNQKIWGAGSIPNWINFFGFFFVRSELTLFRQLLILELKSELRI